MVNFNSCRRNFEDDQTTSLPEFFRQKKYICAKIIIIADSKKSVNFIVIFTYLQAMMG